MEFRVLGPLQAIAGPVEVVLARRERILLALLLLHPNQPVSVGRISEAIWGDQQPRKAAGQVHGTVYRLRKQLAIAGIPEAVILTDPAGYRTQIDPEALDLIRFRQLRDQARTTAAGGEPEQAAAQYRAGLDLWRGSALAGIDSDLLQQSAAALDEEHLQAWQECLETELALGRTGELVAELTNLVGQHPHREGLHRLLMLALYRAGRQADALAAYRHARKLLRDELGIEPGPELQRLHQAILNRDPELNADRSQPTPAAATEKSPVPRELPADVAGFTGRADALRALEEMLAAVSDKAPAPVVISAIAGTAGVGKTALAIHWAHRVADQFPDGQLYINLRGYASEARVRPIEALSALLRSLGTPPERIPTDEEQAAALYRTALADRRALIVLDNTATVDQVRPLLPGSPGCLVLVTSRDRLSGLVARDGAHRVALDVLAPDEAQALLATLLGEDRLRAEPNAATALAKACAYVPLALRVAAEFAAARPTVALAYLVAELSDRRRLTLLDGGGDPLTTVSVIFSWSIQHLPPPAAQMFRLLGLHPGPDFDVNAAAALAGTRPDDARRALEALVGAHLIYTVSPNRYGMHDLLHTYAIHLVSEDSDEGRRAALQRLFDFYLAVAMSAMDKWHPAEAHLRPRIPAPSTQVPALIDTDDAREWLEAERANLVAIVAHAAAQDWTVHTFQLASTIYRYLDMGHYYNDGRAVHSHACRAAAQAGRVVDQAHALRHLATADARMCQYESSVHHLQQSLVLFRRAGDQSGEAMALTNLGIVEWSLGHNRSSAEHHQQAVAVFQRTGDLAGKSHALNNLGIAEQALGRYELAAKHYEQAIALCQKVGNRRGEASTLNNLGNMERRLGQLEQATDHLQQAMALFRQLDSQHGEAVVLDSLGVVDALLGQPEQGIEHVTQALTQFQKLGERDGEVSALNSYGEITHMLGRASEAIAHHTKALALATDTDIRDQQARAHTGLGHAFRTLGEPTRARKHYEQAFTLYTDLGMPDAEVVRTDLTDLVQS